MTNADVANILKSAPRGLQLLDERSRTMKFPTRRDYILHLQKYGLIVDEVDFISSDRLNEAVYRDWLSRPQVGCIFAQLLSRSAYRTGIRTVVARGVSGRGDPRELASQISGLVDNSVNDACNEALSVLLPQILDPESLAQLVWELSKVNGTHTRPVRTHRPGWAIEKERSWRGTLVLIGLRVEIAPAALAETLGHGTISAKEFSDGSCIPNDAAMPHNYTRNKDQD